MVVMDSDKETEKLQLLELNTQRAKNYLNLQSFIRRDGGLIAEGKIKQLPHNY